jgi:hypothetical protein
MSSIPGTCDSSCQRPQKTRVVLSSQKSRVLLTVDEQRGKQLGRGDIVGKSKVRGLRNEVQVGVTTYAPCLYSASSVEAKE